SAKLVWPGLESPEAPALKQPGLPKTPAPATQGTRLKLQCSQASSLKGSTMPLTEYELDWLAEVSKKPVDEAPLEKAAQQQQKREDFLKESVSGVLDKKRKQIEDAQQVVLKSATKTTGIEKLWRQARGKSSTKVTKMPWRAKDEDLGSGWQTRMDLE